LHRSTLLVLTTFLLLAIAWTWPVAAHLTSRVPHDAGDPLLNIWILWWNAQVMPLTERWWNASMMWPVPGAMALSEHLLGLSLFATPLQLAGASVLTAHNVVLILTYAMSGFFAFLLVRWLTGSMLAGICAGLAFGFSPYRASQLSHIQVLSAQWMPLALLGLHAFLQTGRRWWLVVFGGAWLLQALSNGYFLLFFPILIAAWLAWFVDWRHAPRRGLELVAAWVVSSLPLAPILWKYYSVHSALGLRRTVPELRDFSATAASFFQSAPMIRFWPESGTANYELFLFPGLTVLILTAIGIVAAFLPGAAGRRSTRSPVIFYSLAALLMAALALGPGGQGNEPASPLYPFTWLLWLPGFDGVRVTARFAMIVTLCLAVTAGFGAAWLAALGRRWQVLLGVAAVGGLALDGATEPVPILTPPGRLMLPDVRDPAIVELPMDNIYVSVAAMYRSMAHRQPLINGYSGHFPPHYNVLTLSLAGGDTSALLALGHRRPLVIVVNDQRDPGHGYRTMIENIPGIKYAGITAGGSTFVLPAQAPPRQPPRGQVLAATTRVTGRYQLEIDLSSPHFVSGLEFDLRDRYRDLSSRFRIEMSDDGQVWREAWTGWTGRFAIDAMLADARRAPLRVPLSGERARYIRLYPASEWMTAEIRVTGD
jgi:hypothetical protein